jgi:zinc protease
MGTTDSIKEIKLEDVKRFYSTFFVDGNATLVLVGAIDKNQAKSIAEKLTKDLPRGPKAPRVSPAKALSKNMEADVPFPSSQTAIRLGELGISHHNKDYFPLVVGNYILGGGTLVSQLAIEVREKRGLTYGITSQFLPLPAIGPFIINLSTKASQSDAAIKLIRDILAQFVKQGPTDKELTAAKQYLTGSFPLSLSSNSNIARMLLQIQFYKLPEDYLDTYVNNINNVSTTDIKKAFQQNVWTDKMLLVTVGKS